MATGDKPQDLGVTPLPGSDPSGPPLFNLFVDAARRSSGVVSLGDRDRAIPLRRDLEDRISVGRTVDLDFEGIEATQSFMDELIGILVLERGPEVLSLIRFRRCSADMKGIIKFVVSDRAEQHLRNPHFFAPR